MAKPGIASADEQVASPGLFIARHEDTNALRKHTITHAERSSALVKLTISLHELSVALGNRSSTHAKLRVASPRLSFARSKSSDTLSKLTIARCKHSREVVDQGPSHCQAARFI